MNPKTTYRLSKMNQFLIDMGIPLLAFITANLLGRLMEALFR